MNTSTQNFKMRWLAHWPSRIAAALLFLGSSLAMAQTAPVDSALAAAIEAVLKAKPELVRDALEELQRRELAEQARREREALVAVRPELVATEGTTVLGNPQGDVTVVEFLDYRCGYCRKMAPGVDQLLAADPKLKVHIKHLPILGPDSLMAAQLAVTAGQGAQAEALHRALLEVPELSEAALRALPGAKAIFDKGLGASTQALLKNQALAERLGIQGTPALIVGDFIFRGAIDPAQLANAIQATRENQAKAAPPKS
jgi:protein-disulfide isomerase